MPLDPDVCYRALASRDARFDGRFFVGVTSTGIYCRPICPARTPLRRNCRFFPAAAAAADAGFRACRRCRPEASPGSAAWHGTSAVVTRALRLVAEGALDRGSVAELAARVGTGERHLRRLFVEHVGAAPLAVAQTRRVHFAKQLLDETSLPVTAIAHAAGFASVRRFNAAMRAAWGTAPRALRRAPAPAARGAAVVLRLGYRPPFDADALLDYLARRAIPGVEEVADGAFRRSVAFERASGVIEVRPDPGAHQLQLHVPAALVPHVGAIAARVRRLFDLDADPAPIAAQLGRDPELARRLGERPGVRVAGAWSGFELAVRAILGQQVTVAGATTLAGRLAERLGEALAAPVGGVQRLAPGPGALARADLASLGMPRARAEALRALARAALDGRLDLDGALDPDEAVRRLEALPGVGPWTAQYVALRALGVPDAFPASDLGLRRALAAGGRPLSARALEQRAEAWRPWRGYAAVLLWTTPRHEGDVPFPSLVSS
jgi:AraC family transcriptional regulator of adaptative response / DNA-3-methyladenine glycosylase II